MRRGLTVLATSLALLASATAASGSGLQLQVRGPAGIVPHRSAQRSLAERFLQAVGAGPLAGSGPLAYHGGPVMHTNTTYTIFWFPAGYTLDPSYQGTIDRYFQDVQAASGSSSNVYSVATQYYDSNGAVQYQSTFGGTWVDRNTPLPNSCNDGVDTVCLVDTDYRTEVEAALAANPGWLAGPASLFFVLTPPGVGSCWDASATECTTNVYCAYHSAFGTTTEPVVYAVEPYNATIQAGCNSGQSPNGNPAADDELNTISHEHNEAITDPLLNAWYSDDGHQDENGDLCAWTFGSPLGGASGSEYNEVINGDHYWLQSEYSNNGQTCLQNTMAAEPAAVTAPVAVGAPAVSGTAAVSQTLTTSVGSWTGSPTAYLFQWLRCGAGGTGCTSIPGATGSTYVVQDADGGYTLEASVSATNLAGTESSLSDRTAVVVARPAVTNAPRISGKARSGHSMTASAGSWSGPPTSFSYQWLRCGALGTRCVAIARATRQRYTPTKHDVGHRLKILVTARNSVGGSTAASAATAMVHR